MFCAQNCITDVPQVSLSCRSQPRGPEAEDARRLQVQWWATWVLDSLSSHHGLPWGMVTSTREEQEKLSLVNCALHAGASLVYDAEPNSQRRALSTEKL